MTTPVPAEVDLRDFPFMPLEVDRLRKSKAWLLCKRKPHLAFYLLNLWTAAWHELPAGSLEDDDDVLADRAMCPPDVWPTVRDDLMRGWVKGGDGRWYHPVVVEKVLEAWERKQAQRQRTSRARLAKLATKSQTSDNTKDNSVTESVTERVTELPHSSDDSATASKGQGQGQGKEITTADAVVVPGEQPPVTNVHPLPAVPACPHEAIIAEYHRLLPELPAVRIWDDRRQSLLRSRWREDPERQTVAWWTGFFEYVRRCPFLLGQAEGRRDPFLADLEWLIRPQNFAKVIEGRYERAAGQA